MRNDNVNINTPEQLRKQELKAKDRKVLEVDELDQQKQSDIALFNKNPLKYLLASYAKSGDLGFNKSRFNYLLLILLAKIADK